MMKRAKISIICSILCLIITSQSMAESINIGGDKKIEVINGEISEATAKHTLRYLKNVYNRNGSVTRTLNDLLKYYHGKLEPDFMFLLAKSMFMDALRENAKSINAESVYDKKMFYKWSSISRQSLKNSFYQFLQVFDGYRDHNIVKSGQLTSAISKAIKKILSDPKFGLADRASYAHLDNLLRYGALWKYITGRESKSINTYINKKYTKDASYNINDYKNAKGKKFSAEEADLNEVYWLFDGDGNAGIYYIITSEREYKFDWDGAGQKSRPRGRDLYAEIFLNIVSKNIAAEAEYMGMRKKDSKICAPENEYGCWHIQLPGGGSGFDNYFDGGDLVMYIGGKEVKYSYPDRMAAIYSKSAKDNGHIKILAENGNVDKPFDVTGDWDGRYGYEFLEIRFVDDGYRFTARKLHNGKLTLYFDPIKDAILYLHGSIYEWVGIIRDNEVL